MKVGTLALLAIGVAYLVMWVRTRVHAARASMLPPGVSAPSSTLRAHSHSHYDQCMAVLRQFAAAYRSSFQHGKCSAQEVRALQGLREQALGHMYQLRMRLPNDLPAERNVTLHIEETDRLLRAHVAEVQARCGQALLHPGPIEDMYYREFYRAYNDSTQ